MNFYYSILIIILSVIGCNSTINDQNNSGQPSATVLDGQYIETSPDGLITIIGNFNNGKRNGSFMYFDKKGKLQAQENYLDDKLHSTQITVHNTGKINKSINYTNGEKEGQYTIYYKTGKLQETGSYVNGKKDGEIIWYYETGQKNILYTYKNGELNGPTKVFSKEGALIEEGVYIDGLKQ